MIRIQVSGADIIVVIINAGMPLPYKQFQLLIQTLNYNRCYNYTFNQSVVTLSYSKTKILHDAIILRQKNTR